MARGNKSSNRECAVDHISEPSPPERAFHPTRTLLHPPEPSLRIVCRRPHSHGSDARLMRDDCESSRHTPNYCKRPVWDHNAGAPTEEEQP
mmetsp:Transcript_15135/g.49375  ORF Transcript_15135/g.49375 Transcript_15135/m.49375 type:complete len:91 (+) Transcript_15135:720-992(+)